MGLHTSKVIDKFGEYHPFSKMERKRGKGVGKYKLETHRMQWLLKRHLVKCLSHQKALFIKLYHQKLRMFRWQC